MGINLDDILGNRQQDVLVDKSKRTMNILMIGVLVTVIIIVIIAIKIWMANSEKEVLERAQAIYDDSNSLSAVVTERYTAYKRGEKELIGKSQDREAEQKIIKLTSGGKNIEFRYGYYFLTKEEVKTLMNGKPLKIQAAYVVKYSTGEVVSLEGVKYNNKMYYEVADLEAIIAGRVPPTDNTFIINRPEDMKYFAENPGKTFRLNHDIDMSAFNGGNGWTPIPSFRGSFDGRGYKIMNMKINNSSQEKAGLFGTIEAGAYLKNLVLENIDVAGGDYVGAIAGSCSGTIKNCTVSGNVRSTGRYCGGLFGNFEGEASGLRSSVSVNGTEYVGGFAGQVTGGKIVQCCAKGGDLKVIGNDSCVGGFVGLVQSNRDLEIKESCAVSEIFGTEKVGGFIGWINAANSLYELYINNCYSQGNITRCEKSVGGFMGAISSSGRANISLKYNYTTCKTPSSSEDRGGFVGTIGKGSTPAVSYCYWERQSLNDQSLAENGVGFSDSNSVKFPPLTPEAIKLQREFDGWDSVIKNWRFSNKTAPTLAWE